MHSSTMFFLCRYLVTTFKVVPRGTEGAVSVEGTVAGVMASIVLASVGCFLGEVHCSILTSFISRTYRW